MKRLLIAATLAFVMQGSQASEDELRVFTKAIKPCVHVWADNVQARTGASRWEILQRAQEQVGAQMEHAKTLLIRQMRGLTEEQKLYVLDWFLGKCIRTTVFGE